MKQKRNFYAGQPLYEAPAISESFVTCEKMICGSGDEPNAYTETFGEEKVWEW